MDEQDDTLWGPELRMGPQLGKRAPTRLNWLGDFVFGDGVVYVKKTGVRIPLNAEVLTATARWFAFFFAAEFWRLVKLLGANRSPSIAFMPDRPRPWYLIWPVLHAAGARIVNDPSRADVVFHFDDATTSPSPLPLKTRPGVRLVNFACLDVSKSRVAEAFEEAFGYPLRIDPAVHQGPAVEKSELNGVHDGRMVHCPAAALGGRVYQRLVDNRIDPDTVADLRTPTVGGLPACVFIKERPIGVRFSNDNTRCSLKAAQDVFSPDELAAIARFTRLIGLDWGGLDVLRDASDGRLYIVDANKTDMGPPTSLAFSEKLRATRLLASALSAYLAHPRDIA
jgi:hypothetical protein